MIKAGFIYYWMGNNAEGNMIFSYNPDKIGRYTSFLGFDARSLLFVPCYLITVL